MVTNLTYMYAGILVVIGLVGYFATGRSSVTALIPAFFAIVVLVVHFAVGKLAGPTALRWTLIALAVVGTAATVGGIPKVISLMSGGEVARPAAAISQAIMAIVSLSLAILLVFKTSGGQSAG
jgi:hypothetical protein